MTNPQLAQLFAQIDELHTALAAAQEQQLAAVRTCTISTSRNADDHCRVCRC